MTAVYLNDELKHSSARMAHIEGEPYLDAAVLASALGCEIKTYPEQGLVVVCRDDACLPLPCGDGSGGTVAHGGAILVGLGAVSEFLRFAYAAGEREVRLTTGAAVEKRIEQKQAGVLNVGDPMPDFVLPGIPSDRPGAGERVALSRFRGRKLAIYAWASW